VARYELLVDGRRQRRVRSADDVRAWVRGYVAEHAEDDPDAVHVQVRELSVWAWLTGGRLLDRDAFLRESPGPTGD
jgi:hypothetical protein